MERERKETKKEGDKREGAKGRENVEWSKREEEGREEAFWVAGCCVSKRCARCAKGRRCVRCLTNTWSVN